MELSTKFYSTIFSRLLIYSMIVTWLLNGSEKLPEKKITKQSIEGLIKDSHNKETQGKKGIQVEGLKYAKDTKENRIDLGNSKKVVRLELRKGQIMKLRKSQILICHFKKFGFYTDGFKTTLKSFK